VGRTITGGLTAPDRITQTAARSAIRPEEAAQNAEARRPDVRASHERTEALRASAKEPLYRLAPTLGASAQIHATFAPDFTSHVAGQSPSAANPPPSGPRKRGQFARYASAGIVSAARADARPAITRNIRAMAVFTVGRKIKGQQLVRDAVVNDGASRSRL